MSDDLREQVAHVIGQAGMTGPGARPQDYNLAGLMPAADAALAVVRERLARDIAALLAPESDPTWLDGSDTEAFNDGLREALAVVRGVGEAKP